MFTQFMLISLACLGICIPVCVAATKRTMPITVEDAKVLWTLHKQNSRCRCKNWSLLKPKKDKVNGFICECGFKYTQKKPIIS